MNVCYTQTSVGQPSVKTPRGDTNANVQKATHTIQLPRTVKILMNVLKIFVLNSV